MRLIKIVIIFLCLFTFTPVVKAENTINVSFISCGSSTGFFWPKVESFMQAAAEDLNIDLEVIYADMNHIRMKEIAIEVANRENPPDYLIIDNYKLMAGKIIQAIEPTNVKVFVMANGLTKEQLTEFGRPREKYPNWIGQLTPDNHFVGFQTAQLLIQESLKHNSGTADGTLNLIALSGDAKTPAGLQRLDGLVDAVSLFPGVVLQQIIPCHWQHAEADKKIRSILKRYPNTNGIWSASDEMALGAMEGSIALGKKPGDDIFFVGVNWKKEALQKIVDKSMLASGGGHFMLGGWTLVLLHDYHKGKDFAEENVQLKMRIFDLLDNKNVDDYLSHFGDEDWSTIHFDSFSKVLNPGLQTYDFSLPMLLKEAD